MEEICLICLHPYSHNNSPNKSFEWRTRQSTVTPFKMLLRHLKIDPTKWTNFNLTLNLALCHRCNSITNEFLELFQEFERIRLLLDLRICQLEDLMGTGNGDKDKEHDEKFKRQKSVRKLKEVEAGAGIVECLRKETMEKVSLHLKCSAPRVSLIRLENVENEMNKKSTNKTPSFSQVAAELQKRVDKLYQEEAEDDDDAYEEAVDSDSLDWTPDSDAESEYCQDNISSNDNCKLNANPPITESVPGPSPWKCILCGEGFPAKDNLEIHQLSKHVKSFIPQKGIKLLPSSISERKLGAALVEIVSEVKTSDVNLNLNECPFCRKDEGFQGKFQVGTHLLRQHLPKIITKINENNSMDTRNERKNVTVKTTISSDSSKSGPPWRCEYCDRNFSGNNKVEQHQMSMHPIPVLMKKGLLPSSSGISEKQIMSAFGDIFEGIKQPYLCPLCKPNKCHSSKYLLRAHFTRRHPHHIIKKLGLSSSVIPVPGDDVVTKKCKSKPKIRMTCNLCGKHLSGSYHLKIHRVRVHLTTVLRGSLPSSTTEEDLNEAIRRITSRSKIVARNKNNSPLYECILCKKRVWVDLKAHLPQCHLEQVVEEMKNRPNAEKQTLASKIKLYKCVHCDKSFRRKARTRSHALYYCPNRPKQVLEDDFQKNMTTGKDQSAETSTPDMGNSCNLHDDAQSIKVDEYQLTEFSNDGDNEEDVSKSQESILLCSFDPDASVNVKCETD